MKTDDVYSATVINGNFEVFVQKRNNGAYRELRTNAIYQETDLINLISLSKILDLSIDVSVPMIIKIFHESKYKEYYFHGIFIADIAEKDENELKIIEKNRLFYKKNNEFIDLFNYEKYTNNDNKVIINEKLFLDFLGNEFTYKKQPRNKIITLYNKQFKKIV